MKINPYDISYECLQVFGINAYFTSLRIDQSFIPSNLYCYEIREESGEPCQIGWFILVNHFGTLITKEPIKLDADGYRDVCSEDFNWLVTHNKSIEEILKS